MRTAVAFSVLGALLAGLTGTPFVAQAHLGHPIVRAERALLVSLTDAPTVMYVVQLAASESTRARREADVDGDGTVSTTEGNAQVDRWTATLGREVHFAFGRGRYGATRALAEAKVVSVESSGLVAADDDKAMVRVTWVYALPPLGDEDRLRIDDALDITTFDHSEIRVLDTPSRPLLGIGDDPSVLSVSPQIAWVDAARPGARSIHVVWRPREKKLFPVVPVVFGAAVVSLLGLAWLTAQRRKRR
jgi:hypothetical protein